MTSSFRILAVAGACCVCALTTTGCNLRLQPKVDPFYQAVLAENPDHGGARLLVAESLRAQGRFEEAEAAYQDIVAADEMSAQGWRGLGLTQLEVGRFERAHKAFDRAWALEEEPIAAFGRAEALALSGDPRAAGEAIEAFRARFGETAAYWQLVGDLRFVESDMAGARDAYRESLALRPDQPALRQRVTDLNRILN